MIEYKPTTADMRERASQAGIWGFDTRRAAEFDRWLTEYTRIKQAEALEEAASSPIPREALTNGTRAWLRTRAEAYRQERGEQ